MAVMGKERSLPVRWLMLFCVTSPTSGVASGRFLAVPGSRRVAIDFTLEVFSRQQLD